MARDAGGRQGRWAVRRAEWRRRLAEWAACGETQAAYCRRHSLDQNTFSGWKRRLKFSAGVDRNARIGDAAQRDGLPAFIPLRLSGAGSGAAALTSMAVAEVVLRNGRVLRIPAAYDVAAAARLASALEAAPC